MESRIKELRKAHGLTQAELGKKLSVQKAAISKYEKGTVTPNGDVLKRLSAIFNVSTDYLLNNEVKRAGEYSEDQKTLLADYDSLNTEGQSLIMNMLGSLRVTHSKARNGAFITNSDNGNNYGVVGGNFSSKVTIK